MFIEFFFQNYCFFSIFHTLDENRMVYKEKIRIQKLEYKLEVIFWSCIWMCLFILFYFQNCWFFSIFQTLDENCVVYELEVIFWSSKWLYLLILFSKLLLFLDFSIPWWKLCGGQKKKTRIRGNFLIL